jgi:hypothetical protein
MMRSHGDVARVSREGPRFCHATFKPLKQKRNIRIYAQVSDAARR